MRKTNFNEGRVSEYAKPGVALKNNEPYLKLKYFFKKNVS